MKDINCVECQTGKKVKELRTNGEKEFIKAFKMLVNEGRKASINESDTTQENGGAERLNRTLLETIKSML